MKWRRIGVVLIFLFTFLVFTMTVGFAQETSGSGSADPVDQGVAIPDDASNIASGKAISLNGNEPLGQPGLGGTVSSDAEPADLGDEPSIASNSQIVAQGGQVIEDEEDWSAVVFAEPGLGGETSAEPRLPPDIDDGGKAGAAADAN